MCGIAGFLDPAARNPAAEAEAIAARMGGVLGHRGPDAGATWTEPSAGLGLAHRRLAIVDLSPAGAQPMESADGRLVLVYNGEIYNAPELRRDLEAAGAGPFRGHSDTEVVVESCRAWGVEAAVARFIGMFAFALWDRETRRLTLVRDRLGIKPLYVGRGRGGVVLFGSELAALRTHPAWRGGLDREAVAGLLRFGYVPGPLSIHPGIESLAPGTLLTFDAEGAEVVRTAFWRLTDAVAAGARDPLRVSDAEAADALETLLSDAVSRRMVADVPLGAFLSGGIDSSVVTALMQRASDRPVRTFTIGFAEKGYDEAAHARAVAAHLGTDHTELTVGPGDALDLVTDLPRLYDAPFADASQIPTALLCRLARRHVTVALSGDGGDELFGGYARHVFAAGPWQWLRRVPAPLRRLAAAALLGASPDAWQRLFDRLPDRLRPFAAGDRLHKLADVLAAADDRALYRRLVSQWPGEALPVNGATASWGLLAEPAEAADAVDRMRLLDALTYLPDDILTKVDRASMAVGLEARVPVLDHRVAEFAWRLPPRMVVRHGRGKWLLRQVLYRHVPAALMDRPKQGFAVPLADWLRGPLRDWAEALLDPAVLAADGLLDAGRVRAAWQTHLSGRRNMQYRLWPVLMLQAWRREWRT